jgi:hypothetical protein
VVFIINLMGTPARTIFPFAGALVALGILLDNTFIVACASPSAIINCLERARATRSGALAVVGV